MKRLLLSIILALGFHVIILNADFRWLELAPRPALKSRSIALVLSTVKSREAGLEATALQLKHPAPQETDAHNQIAEQQPGPNASSKPQKDPDQVQNPVPIKPKKNLKALTLKKQTIKTIETVRPASIDKRHSTLAVEASIGSPANSGAKSSGLTVSTDATLIKKTHSLPNEFSEPLTRAAAVPATGAQEILSESVSVRIANPTYKQNVAPKYPLRARRLGYEGLVVLKVLVDENGWVDDLEVLKSSGYAILDRAAMSSVKKWMFEPGTEDGRRKKMWVKIPIRFHLE